MNIGIVGARVIGGTLGKKWAAAGHHIKFGVRHPDNPEVQALAQSLGDQATVGSVADGVAFGEVIVFAIPGRAMDETIIAESAALQGKIVIDAANKVGASVMHSVATLTTHAPTAQVFRAFNSLGWENFEHPRFGDVQADLFYCGPAGEAQAVIETLIAAVGLRPVWVGGLDQVQVVDALAGLWFALALNQKRGRHLAFKLLSD